MNFLARTIPLAAALGFATFALSACKEEKPVETGAAVAPQVGIITIEPSPQRVIRELPGRMAPRQVAQVRARVGGIVIERLFKQGAEVKAGDILYRIDPARFEIELDATQAALARAQATLDQADQQARRIDALIKTQAASQAQHQNAIAAFRQAQADVAARKADVARAKLELDYTTVRAPISGRIGRALVTEGALVGQGDPTHLATVQQLDPIYADFTQSAGELQQLRRDFESGALEQLSPDATKVRLLLDDGTLYPHSGRLLFSDVTVDPSTGQVTLRGEFPNPKTELLPGAYVRVQIEQGIDADAITVPQQAVRRNDTGGSEVFVVNSENRALIQPIRTGRVVDGQWIVLDGLKRGDHVIVEGFQKFVAGNVVDPAAWPQTRASASAEGEKPKPN